MVEQATGMLQLAQVDLTNTVIKAPIAGTILGEMWKSASM